MLPKEPKRFSEKMDKTGRIPWMHLTYPTGSLGLEMTSPSYLCSSNHRWSQYRGPCAVSGHPGTRWSSRGGTERPRTDLSDTRSRQVVDSARPAAAAGAHACRLLRPELGPGKQLRRAARRAFRGPRSWPQGRGNTVDPARGPCTLSGWAAALSAPLWFALALFSRHPFRKLIPL